MLLQCEITGLETLYIKDSTFSLLTRNQPHNSFMVSWQYWLGRIKPKSASRMAKSASDMVCIAQTQHCHMRARVSKTLVN